MSATYRIDRYADLRFQPRQELGRYSVCSVPTVSCERTGWQQLLYHSPKQPVDVSNDVPSDVYAVLTQLFEEGESAVLAEEFGTARRTIGTAETVCRNKLPEGELRAQLLHGCDRVQATLDPTEGANADTAAEFLRAMDRRLERAV